MKDKLSISESLTIMGIAYYMRGKVCDLKSAYKRNKGNMSPEALKAMKMVVKCKDPVKVLEAGIGAMEENQNLYTSKGLDPFKKQ